MNSKKIIYVLFCSTVFLMSANTATGSDAPCAIFTNPLMCLGKHSGDWLYSSGLNLKIDSLAVQYVSEPKENSAGLYVEVTVDNGTIINISFLQTISRHSMNVRDFANFRAAVGDHCYSGRDARDKYGLCDSYDAEVRFYYRGINLEYIYK